MHPQYPQADGASSVALVAPLLSRAELAAFCSAQLPASAAESSPLCQADTASTAAEGPAGLVTPVLKVRPSALPFSFTPPCGVANLLGPAVSACAPHLFSAWPRPTPSL